MRTPHIHRLRSNDRTWTPHLVAVWDTEFLTGPPAEGQASTFRCGVGIRYRRHGRPRRHELEPCWATDPDQLCAWIAEAAESGTPLWLYAHHAAVDVQASGLLDYLLQRGWRLSRHGLGNSSMWAVLVNGRRTIHLCDSMSLYGCSLERLGELCGERKGQMPELDATTTEWLAYCQRDVEVLLHALTWTMDEWERLGLGRWTDTGPGCGWNSLRHLMKQGQVLIDPDPGWRAFERGAIFGGRRELLRFGFWPEQEYCDLDLQHAHLSVACHFALPSQRGRPFDSLPLDSPLIGGAGVGCIARALVRCSSPRYPMRTRAGVVYPVGEFWTTLAGPELNWARERGELLQVGPGCGYRLAHWAAPWAEWLANVLDGPSREVAPPLRQMLKGCSKTVWGRTAMRVTGTVAEQDGPTEELRLERGWDHHRGAGMTIVDYGWRRRIEVQDQESDDSFPAILAWIQSWVRVLVGRLVDAIGTDAVTAICTDGVLAAPWRLAELACEVGALDADDSQVSEVARAACRALGPELEPLRLRLKDVLHRVRALGPETVESDEGRTVAGVPRSAERVGAWTYQGEVWPSFVTMTQAPWSGAVLVSERLWHCDGARPLRWVLEDGRCEPLWAARVDGNGSSSVLARLGPVSGGPVALRDDQHPALMAVLRGGELAELRGPPRPP